MMNLYRIFYYQIMKGAVLPKRVIDRVREQGYIEYNSEFYAVVNNIVILQMSAKGKPNIKSD